MGFLDILGNFLSFILHLQEHLQNIVDQYGLWTYALLFLVIFAETGFVILPFLPGDSLLFAAGAFASTDALSVGVLFVLLTTAAILGDSFNYALGRGLSRSVFTDSSRLFKKKYLEKTEAFYEKHGGKTIILARFIPIIRTFAPCVAGMGKMNYPRFLLYNIVGGLAWITLFLFGGYFFGHIAWVQHNFGVVIIAIILASLLPILYNFLKVKREKKQAES